MRKFFRVSYPFEFSLPALLLAFGIGSVFPLRCDALENGLARTPPMGWNSWNTFQKNIHERLVHGTVDAMISTGMKAAGYQYICIDDGWQLDGRDQSGNLRTDIAKFPSGMKALGDYIHSKGLKYGIYTSAGVKTCMSLEGSYGYEFQDAKLFASWGVDFVKVDWCCTNPKYLEKRDCNRAVDHDYATTGQKELFERWRDAILQSGCRMVLSICEWGTGKPWLWGKEVGNLWRTTDDIVDCWDCHNDKVEWGGLGWTRILDLQVGLEPYAGPGHWNDPDMLVVGIKELTDVESRAHFSLWCMLAAPLMTGNDIRNMSRQTLDILTNPEVLAVDQDAGGIQGRRASKAGDREIWVKPLMNNATAVVLFNRGVKKERIAFQWRDVGFKSDDRLEVRDLWDKKALGLFENGFSSEVLPHGVVMLRLSH